MIALTQLATSTEPVQLLVEAFQGGSQYNPSSDPVAIAILPDTSPEPDHASASWHAASWEVDAGNLPSYWATILVGPLNGGIALAAGSYVVYLMITDSPAVPIKPGAYLTIV